MYRTFNYGIGMVLIVSEQEADDVMVRLNGLKESAFLIGEVAKCADDEEGVLLV
jgi:phosphoribosylformylglycinamidine cyclo-ligase